jgi:hypothetical protein
VPCCKVILKEREEKKRCKLLDDSVTLECAGEGQGVLADMMRSEREFVLFQPFFTVFAGCLSAVFVRRLYSLPVIQF